VLGTWGVDVPTADHLTFSCELRPYGAMALDAPLTLTETPSILGLALTRDQALVHRKISDFWAVVDVIAAHDPAVRRTVYERPSS
jgi:hypothetical protein